MAVFAIFLARTFLFVAARSRLCLRVGSAYNFDNAWTKTLQDEFTMTEQTNLDQRFRLPYSIGTGIPKHGKAEIEGYLQSLRVQGFCVIECVIPEDVLAAARDNVLRGRQL